MNPQRLLQRVAFDGQRRGRWRAVCWLTCMAAASAFVAGSMGDVALAQYQQRSLDGRRQSIPPTPAPRSRSGDTTVLPRVPYDQGRDLYRPAPYRSLRSVPDTQRVVPAPPPAGGDPARFFDPPAASALSCESLRRLAERTGRLYWVTRYKRCIGVD